MDKDVDKRKTAFTTTTNYTSKAEKLVNLGSQTTKFCCPTSNHPGLTLRLLYMYMTMQLRSGHVSLRRTKFQLLNCPNQTHGAGQPYVGLCPIFLVLITFCYSFFSTRDLRGQWADLGEILPHVRKHVQFTNVGPRI